MSLALRAPMGLCLVSQAGPCRARRGSQGYGEVWGCLAQQMLDLVPFGCCFHSVPALPRQLLPARLSAGSGAEQRVGLHPGLARGSRPFWASKASDISDEVQELDLENILPILAGRWGPGVEPSAPCASRVKHCQYEIMFQLQDQTDWFNSYHESILLYYHALTL